MDTTADGSGLAQSDDSYSNHLRPALLRENDTDALLEVSTSDSDGNSSSDPRPVRYATTTNNTTTTGTSSMAGPYWTHPQHRDSDDESDSGWSDTDDDSLEGKWDNDPLDILDGRGPRDDDDDACEEASIRSSQSWSPSLSGSQRASLRNPYNFSSSSSVSDVQVQRCHSQSHDSDNETLADTPSVQAIWNEEESAIISQSSLQLRGYAENATLRQELSELVANQPENFWIITTGHQAGDSESDDSDDDEAVSIVTDGGGFYHAEGVVTIAETVTTAGLSDEDSDIDSHDSDSEDDGGHAADQNLEEISMASTNAYREVDPMIMEVAPTHHPRHRRQPTPPASKSVSWAVAVENDTVISKDDNDEDDDSSLFFDVEQGQFDFFKKMVNEPARRNHKVFAAAMFLLGLFLLLLFTLRRNNNDPATRTINPVFSHIYLASPSTPSSIRNATVVLSENNQGAVTYHAYADRALRLDMRVPMPAETETRVVGVSDRQVRLATPCPTDGVVLYQNTPERAGAVIMDVVLDGGADASLVKCHDDVVVAAHYIILNKPNIMDRVRYQIRLGYQCRDCPLTRSIVCGTV
eukprot:scaffold39709_cov168-Amphora_coffeaeformis.AAC.1